MALACIPPDIICNPYTFFLYECRCVQKVVKIVCLSHDMLQSVIVSGAVIYHISNVNGVLQYTRITALCNTSVIFLAVENNYLQGQICLSPILRLSSRNRFQLLSPFGFYGDILELVYTTLSCGTMVSAMSRKPAEY